MSELQQLLDPLVAAGAPGAAGWIRDERGSPGAAGGLANRTGGVPDRTATLEQALYASRPGRLRAWTPQALVAMVADQPPAFPAGTDWSYSNTGYVLLGLVVEAASQRTLGQELDRSILGPLGLRDTLLPDSAPEIPGPSARGYSLPLGSHGEPPAGPCSATPAASPAS